MRTFLATVAMAGALFSTAAMAQTEPQSPQALTDVYSCAQIGDDAQRLRCYDGAVGRLRQAESTGQVVAVDRSQAAEIERDSFGFHLPSIARLLPNLQGGADQPLENVQMTVASIRTNALGYSTFVMENGQIWEQVEPRRARNVRAGDVITIERAALGSFRLISPRGGAGHRVRRQE